MIRRVGYLAVLICGCVSIRHQRESGLDEALVQPDRLIVTFLAIRPETTKWPAPSPAFPGYYDWRFGVSGPGGFTASASVLASDTTANDAHGSISAVARDCVSVDANRKTTF